MHDLDRGAANELVVGGAAWAASPAAAARVSDAVITCLPSVAAATEVVAGANGLLEGFAPGALWMEMGTNDPRELVRLAGLLAQAGVDTLEAPVTGGVHNASSGTITILVGGDEEVFRLHESVFRTLGGRVFFVGALGTASSIKVVSNMLAFIHIAASAEAFMLCKRSGVDLRLAWEYSSRELRRQLHPRDREHDHPERQLRRRLLVRPLPQGSGAWPWRWVAISTCRWTSPAPSSNVSCAAAPATAARPSTPRSRGSWRQPRHRLRAPGFPETLEQISEYDAACRAGGGRVSPLDIAARLLCSGR